MPYNRFSDYLKKKYGEKVYKLPVNLPVTCPNRDGTLGTGGCIFCGEEGAGFENLPSSMGVRQQLQKNAQYIERKYNAKKFIAYFQNYSNTYLPAPKLREYLTEACRDEICALYISTRPDCITKEHADVLKYIRDSCEIDIVVELGLQTVNYKTLKWLERGHTLAEFINAAGILKNCGVEACAHYIIDLPADTMEDVVEGAKILSALAIRQVKCHSLYILEGTRLAELYKSGEFKPVSMEEYMERIITFLEYLDPGMVIQRLIGRAPAGRTLFCSWNTSWWKIRDIVEKKMDRENRFQGKKFTGLTVKRL